MHRIALTPGSMGTVGLAIDLFGISRIDPGTWLGPVFVHDVEDDEFAPAAELLAEAGIQVQRS